MKKILLILLGIAVFALLFPYFFYDPGNFKYFPSCPLYSISGIYCPGCGSQRAMHDLLHLNIVGAIGHNMLIVPAIIVVVYNYTIKLLENKRGAVLYNFMYEPKAPIIVFMVIMVFWILRNIPVWPFDKLAP